jgi:hypothetical protein
MRAIFRHDACQRRGGRSHGANLPHKAKMPLFEAEFTLPWWPDDK